MTHNFTVAAADGFLPASLSSVRRSNVMQGTNVGVRCFARFRYLLVEIHLI